MPALKRLTPAIVLVALLQTGLVAERRSGPQAASQPTPPSAQRDTIEGLVAEPIFEGNAYVYETGRANPYSVVLVHGLNGSANDWARVIPALASRFHVVAFDLPGFGRSDKRNEAYTPANYAAFVKWVVDQRVNRPYTLVGHSMGGVVALRLAATYPANLRHLVLVDVAGVLQRTTLYGTTAALGLDVPSSGTMARPLRTLDDWLGAIARGADYRGLSSDIEAVLGSAVGRERTLRGEPAVIAATALANEDVSRRIDFVTQPVTLIWGAKDQVAPLRTGRALVARLANARLMDMPGIGHVPMQEAPGPFCDLLLPGLREPVQPKAAPPTWVASDRTVKITGQRDQVVTGAFRRLEIENCTNLKLSGVTAGSLVITGSSVDIEDSLIVSSLVGIEARDAKVTITGGRVTAATCIVADGTTVDSAGVAFEAQEAVVKTNTDATAVFSICKARVAGQAKVLHGIEKLAAEPKTGSEPR